MKKIILLLVFWVPVVCGAQSVTLESARSLRVKCYKDDGKSHVGVIMGTGFVIRSKTQYYLITNEHIVTNWDRGKKTWVVKEQPLRPNKIYIEHRTPISIDSIYTAKESLFDGTNIRYITFNSLKGDTLDVVAIPLQDTSRAAIFPVDYDKDFSRIELKPSELATVIGYPKGYSLDYVLPIWKTGRIASEPEIDSGGEPIMWLDLLAYKGMSGSPVYLITNEYNGKYDNTHYSNATTQIFFLGIQTATVEEIGLCKVIKSTYLKPLFWTLR